MYRGYKGDYYHASARGGPPGGTEAVAGTGALQGPVPVKSKFRSHIIIGGKEAKLPDQLRLY